MSSAQHLFFHANLNKAHTHTQKYTTTLSPPALKSRKKKKKDLVGFCMYL